MALQYIPIWEYVKNFFFAETYALQGAECEAKLVGVLLADAVQIAPEGGDDRTEWGASKRAGVSRRAR